MADTANSPKTNPTEFQTPTLKSSVVTTGRGGTGNMARNDDPRETRKRQDVEAVIRRPSAGAQHSGRGGAGNIFKDEEVQKLSRKLSSDGAISEEDSISSAHQGESIAAKGKNWFFGKKA